MKKTFDPHRYAMTLSDGQYATDNHCLYQWNGQYWQFLSDHEAKRIAYRWLVQHDRDFASDANARAAYRSALLWVSGLPERKQETIIPCRNGYVVVRDGALELETPAPEYGVRFVLECDFSPHSTAPRFEKFLDEILPDADVRSRVQEYVGYTLLGDTRFQRAQFWIGPGANGKGVLANIVQALHSKSAAVQLDDLGGFRLSALLGASLIYCDEAPKTGINEQLLKTMIAGEMLQVDRKYLEPLTAQLLGKWLVLGNHLPAIKDHTSGFWRRWDFVPFSQVIPESRRDPLLVERIKANELSGVLNWALEGLLRLLDRGLFDPQLPEAMQQLLHQAKKDTNSVQAWFDDCNIRLAAENRFRKDSVYQHYRTWCEKNGLSPMASPRYWTVLREIGPVTDVRKWQGEIQVMLCNVETPSPFG